MSDLSKPAGTVVQSRDQEFRELDELTAKVIAEGDKILHAQVQESIRLGIIDEKGNLLKHELPEDMREGAERDFGG